MTINRKLDYVILDLIESSQRTIRTAPLNLGALPGSGGGEGAPPGGFIGWLPQTRVAYDTDEFGTLATAISGASLLDNLNHIRYRIGILESGASITVVDNNTDTTYLDTDTIHFSGSGITVSDLGSGDVRITIVASGGTGTPLTVEELDGSPSVSNVDKIIVSGGYIVNVGGGDVIIAFSGGASSTLIVEEYDGSPSVSNVDKIIFSGATVTDQGAGDVLVSIISQLVPYTSTNNIYRSGNPTATSTFTALINGAPTNAANSVVTFDTITVGNATVITPSAAGQLARMRLYNNTRGNYALVVSVSGSTVTVDRNVTTLAAPWQDNDSISTLATGAVIGSSGGIGYTELEIIDATLMGKSALLIEMTQRSSVAAEASAVHPYVAYSAAKESIATCQVANTQYVRMALVTLTNNVLGLWWNGTNNTATIFKVQGYLP